MKTFIVYNKGKQRACDNLQYIHGLLERFSEVVGTTPTWAFTGTHRKDIDVVVVLGGDGTILHVVKNMKDNQLPIAGINFGKLGFLTTFQLEDLNAHETEAPKTSTERIVTFLKTALENPSISHRTILEGCLSHGNVDPLWGNCQKALNDFVINAGEPFRAIYLKVAIDGRDITTIGGDGLIVSTATGSTAYNLSANGPLMLPEAGGIIINALNPHALTYRPLVVHDNAEISIEAVKINPGTALVVDGEKNELHIEQGNKIFIRKAPFTAKLVRSPEKPIWFNLIEKLRWGMPTT